MRSFRCDPRCSRPRRRPRLSLVAAVALLAALGLAGCGGDKEVSTDDCTVIAPTAPGRTEVTVLAENMAFDTSCLQVEPGTLTVTFTNEDKGVPHNFHLFGNGVNEATDIETGHDTQTLKIALPAAGTYDFVCDPHRSSMKGKVVVKAAGEASATAAS